MKFTPKFPSDVPMEKTSRMMLSDDTNPMGNVHGGTILQLMEQTGHIISMRHCNQNGKPDNKVITVLARMEHTDFHLPMYVGEVAHVQGLVTFTSEYSLEVTLDVWAENVITGSKRHTNSARLWYVAIPADVNDLASKFRPVSIPPLTGLSKEEMDSGKKRYEAQKRARKLEEEMVGKEDFERYRYVGSEEPESGSVSASFTTLTNAVLPSDCTLSGHMMGGALMKMLDTAAGICAARHCKSPAVTVSLDAINFHSPILLGEVVLANAHVVFTSAKSVIIEVVCEAKGLKSNGDRVTNTAYFTFVSINEIGQAQNVPQLKITNEEEKRKFSLMKQIYVEKKKRRIAESQKN